MAGTSRDAQMESSASSDDSDSDTDTLLPFFGDGGEARSFTVSKTGWRRLVACIGIKLVKLKQKAACMVAGIAPRALRKGNWLETWDDGGPAGVLATVKRDAIERAGGSWSAEEEEAFKRPTIEMFERQSHPLYASARLWDDGIVDPRKTRDVLALSLRATLNRPIDETRFGVFRM